jgi:uncharacterized protein
MLWRGGRRSMNIEDRRGMRSGRGMMGGGIGGLILLLISLYFGMDPNVSLNPGGTVDATGPVASTPAEEETKEFVSTVVGYTEDTWNEVFERQGQDYREPKLVLFSGAVDSACGFAQSAMGPFYCPADEKVYLDMRFFNELNQRFSAPGDFAQAYVIAHEVGHHIQNITGIMGRGQKNNDASVRLELQADCLAGVWGNQTEKTQRSQAQGFLEPGDVDEALRAASMIGDDQLQMRSQGYVVPESFTHGSAEQRSRWFKRGFETGSVAACDTFSVAQP